MKALETFRSGLSVTEYRAFSGSFLGKQLPRRRFNDKTFVSHTYQRTRIQGKQQNRLKVVFSFNWPDLFQGKSSREVQTPDQAVDLDDVLTKVAAGELDPKAAKELVLEAVDNSKLSAPISRSSAPAIPDLSLDLQLLSQPARFPEVVTATGKTADEIAAVMRRVAVNGTVSMATRVDPQVYEELKKTLPNCRYHKVARICTLGGNSHGLDEWGSPNRAEGACLPGSVVVVSSSSGDLPVAEEVLVTLSVMGVSELQLVTEVTVADMQNLLSRMNMLREADVVVVVAGVDGSLPSVIAGLVDCPVVSVPTSVGSSAAFDGIAPLLASLTASSPGMAVVNVDNGFGGAMLVARMLRQAARIAAKFIQHQNLNIRGQPVPPGPMPTRPPITFEHLQDRKLAEDEDGVSYFMSDRERPDPHVTFHDGDTSYAVLDYNSDRNEPAVKPAVSSFPYAGVNDPSSTRDTATTERSFSESLSFTKSSDEEPETKAVEPSTIYTPVKQELSLESKEKNISAEMDRMTRRLKDRGLRLQNLAKQVTTRLEYFEEKYKNK